MQTILIKGKNRLSCEAFFQLLHKTPVIPALKTMNGLDKVLAGNSGIVFTLFGDIVTIPGIVKKIKGAGKSALVHIDLIDGLTSRDIAVDFLAENTEADGIISTKGNLISRAKACGLLTVQRFFVLDSMALINIEKHFAQDCSDAVEVLPGVMPKIIRKISSLTKKPIIAGGLISDREDIQAALEAGAISVSSSNISLL
ncbi:MAG: glycerol-3-phosphate responsive antiterminator [Treponema sp.]|jgi:glycerol uptake operon antiterminator|nr:glycerol-3-phosphate responsive antiterminator [Treponema sp.]